MTLEARNAQLVGHSPEGPSMPPGYKLTDIGVLPDEWDVGRLGESLLDPPTYGVNAAAIPYSDSDATYLRITDIGEEYDFTPSPRVSVRHPDADRFFLSPGDIVFARTGASVGKSYLYDPTDGPLVFAGFLIRVTPDPRQLLPGFLAFFVQSKPYWDWVRETSVRSGQPGINGREYATLKVPLPPVKEQHAIAEALSDVDGLLGSLDALIAKKQAIKQATMQQLLTGRTRLPGFGEQWKEKRLGELAVIMGGATPSTRIASYWDGTIPWCTPTDITGTTGKYLSSTERRITEEGLASCGANLLPAGSLLLCSRATIGEVKIAQVEVCTNQGFKSLMCNDEVSNEFLYYVLRTLKPQMLERAIGSTFLEIGKRDLAAISSRMPDKDEQIAIANVLSDMDAEIVALERRREKTRSMKVGMMQQLLTGRTRLVGPRGPAEASA